MINTDSIIRTQSKFKINRNMTYDILDGMIDWVRVVDKTGLVIYVNKSMQDGIGFDIIGKRCFSSLGKSCACKRCITQTTIATGVPSEKEETLGDKIYSVKSSPVKDQDGNIYASVEVFRDVTRERKLEIEIIEKNKKMNKDLEFARTLQRKILPQKGIHGNLEIDYIYKPSEFLSGDIFDVFKINDNLSGIYISDVVGHGVTASMMTMFITQTMRALKENICSPSKTLNKLHKRFYELQLDDDKYFTIFYGIIDKENKIFTYSNAGHNSPPILINKDGTKLLEIPGFPITSLFKEIEFDEKSVKLNIDDEIILFTDGIIEARNKSGEEFGLNRLVNLANNKNENIINVIDEEISKFKYSSVDDDFAILKGKVLF